MVKLKTKDLLLVRVWYRIELSKASYVNIHELLANPCMLGVGYLWLR
jgi:hypothetical protein